MNKIKKIDLKDNYNCIPNNVKKIIKQTEKSICEIRIKMNSIKNKFTSGNGFFCKIPFPNENNKLPVLITDYNSFENSIFMNNDKIKFSLNKNKISHEILVDNFRKFYLDEINNIAILEIKESDNLDINLFLEIDDKIFGNKINVIINKEPIYLIYNSQGKNLKYSFGEINYINNLENVIFSCPIESESLGCPIISLKTNKTIGIQNLINKSNQNICIGENFKFLIENFYKNKGISFNLVDEILLKYKLEINNNKIRIFGSKFVENNKGICKISINGKQKELCEFYEIKNCKPGKDDILEIKLTGVIKITNASWMFCGCTELLSLSDISKWNSKDIINMSHMFEGCKNLKNINELLLFNTNKVKDMSYMFYECTSLESLNVIGRWDTNDVQNISYMFYKCTSLKSLKYISKWKTEKVTNMSYLFAGCSSLLFLPDISIWNTENITDMSYMFFKCSSLSYLPDISKWKTGNVGTMKNMFTGCLSLTSFPDISNWNINKVINIKNIFSGCLSLSLLPNITNLDLIIGCAVDNMFEGTMSLISSHY